MFVQTWCLSVITVITVEQHNKVKVLTCSVIIEIESLHHLLPRDLAYPPINTRTLHTLLPTQEPCKPNTLLPTPGPSIPSNQYPPTKPRTLHMFLPTPGPCIPSYRPRELAYPLPTSGPYITSYHPQDLVLLSTLRMVTLNTHTPDKRIFGELLTPGI